MYSIFVPCGFFRVIVADDAGRNICKLDSSGCDRIRKDGDREYMLQYIISAISSVYVVIECKSQLAVYVACVVVDHNDSIIHMPLSCNNFDSPECIHIMFGQMIFVTFSVAARIFESDGGVFAIGMVNAFVHDSF